MHLMVRSKVPDFVERGDLVTAIRWKGDAPAYVENPQGRLTPRRAAQGSTCSSAVVVPPLGRSVARSFHTPVLSLRARGRTLGRHRPVPGDEQVFGIMANSTALGVGDIEVNDTMFRQ